MMKKVFAGLLAVCMALTCASVLAEGGMNTVIPFGVFEADNLRGEDAVTEKIFAKADVTLVNYWATWCPPCRAELPDLASLAALSEGRVQVLGVLLDSLTAPDTRDEDAIATAHILLDDAGETFPVVVPDAWLLSIGSLVTAVPTTFLVDRKGNILTYVEGSRTAEQWIDLASKYYPDAK